MRTPMWPFPIILILGSAIPLFGQQDSAPATAAAKSPAQILEQSRGSVAVIVAGAEKPLKLGTGFFVRSSGLLLTNFHVVENAELVCVKLPKGKDIFWAKTAKGFDVDNDLVVLHVELRARSVRTLRLGDSDNVRIGEPIVVISNPKGLEQTISNGLVSGVREIDGRKLFQITAPVSEGSSGGPVFNERGEVIGMVVSSLGSGQNLNFAIPINYAKPLLQQPTELLIAELPRHKIIDEDSSAGARPGIPDSLPRFWKGTLSGVRIEIRIDGDYLYEESTSDIGRFAVEWHCEAKRYAVDWPGKCRYKVSWHGSRYYEPDTLTCSVETAEVITSVTATRIEGKSQVLDYSPADQRPAQCPRPAAEWHEFALIPIE